MAKKCDPRNHVLAPRESCARERIRHRTGLAGTPTGYKKDECRCCDCKLWNTNRSRKERGQEPLPTLQNAERPAKRSEPARASTRTGKRPARVTASRNAAKPAIPEREPEPDDTEIIDAEIVDEPETETGWAKLAKLARLPGLPAISAPGSALAPYRAPTLPARTGWMKPAKIEHHPLRSPAKPPVEGKPVYARTRIVQFKVINPNGIDCPVDFGNGRCGNPVTGFHRVMGPVETGETCLECWQVIYNSEPKRAEVKRDNGIWGLVPTQLPPRNRLDKKCLTISVPNASKEYPGIASETVPGYFNTQSRLPSVISSRTDQTPEYHTE